MKTLTMHPSEVDSQGRKVLRFTPQEWEELEAKLTALESISAMWPDPGMCAELVPSWVGPNDGRMRADMLWYALNAARKALGLSTYPEPEHWSTPRKRGELEEE